MRSTTVIWIGIGTAVIIIAVVIAVSYYNKMTIRELRSSIELLTGSISNMSRDIANSRQQTVQQQYIPPPPVSQQQYYNQPTPVQTSQYDEQDYYYDNDIYESEQHYVPQIPITDTVNRNSIAHINKLTTMTDTGNVRVRPQQNRNVRRGLNNMNRRF